MRFDAMAGTVREVPFQDVVGALSSRLRWAPVCGNPRGRYSDLVNVETGGRMAVWFGADKVNGTVFFEAKGETTPDFTEAVREVFPEHSVVRGDVCRDFEGKRAFARAVKLVRDNKGAKVFGGYRALPDDRERGKTWEAGVRGGGSVAMVRVYEAGKHPDRLHLNRPDWVRTEFEIRPHYAADKRAAARMSPEQLVGMAAWTAKVASALIGSPIERYEGPIRQREEDAAFRYFALKGRRAFLEQLRLSGDWVCVGRNIEEIWREDDVLNGRRKR